MEYLKSAFIVTLVTFVTLMLCVTPFSIVVFLGAGVIVSTLSLIFGVFLMIAFIMWACDYFDI